MSFVKLVKLWDNLRSGYWFIPTLLALGGVFCTVLCPWIDASYPALGAWVADQGYLIDMEGSRTILSVIASSAITVAGVVFSITMVVLATMSAQFGPRLLPNFMRQDSTKFVLGGFIGTFIYCMLALSQLTGAEGREEVPRVTVLVGLILGIFSFALLIHFIHRVARFIQAPCILEDVACRLRQHIQQYFPQRREGDQAAAEDNGVSFGENGAAVSLECHGYIQLIDMDALLAWATQAQATVQILKRPGEFVVADEEVARIGSQINLSQDDMAAVREAFIVGVDRTDTQDVEFAVDQLVEVAVRAMSPGINDPYTAVNCIDHLRGALALLASRDQPAAVRRDEKGRERLWCKNFTIAGIFNVAFDPLRQHAKSLEMVAIHLMETMASLARRETLQVYRDALRRHARLLREAVQDGFPQESDRDDFDRRYRRFLERMGEN